VQIWKLRFSNPALRIAKRTESYQDNPITIIGAGAGAEVTARGVFGDILRIAENK
jgi:homoserine dehydrogenase